MVGSHYSNLGAIPSYMSNPYEAAFPRLLSSHYRSKKIREFEKEKEA